MSKKRNIAKEINILRAEMTGLESKRSRSVAVILEALLGRVEPNSEDLQYFRTYTAEIEVKRERLQELTKELEDEML